MVGEWDKKGRHMSYPRVHCPRRTDEQFRLKFDEDHHKHDTPLCRLIGIDMIEDFIVADSLHLFDLGNENIFKNLSYLIIHNYVYSIHYSLYSLKKRKLN